MNTIPSDLYSLILFSPITLSYSLIASVNAIATPYRRFLICYSARLFASLSLPFFNYFLSSTACQSLLPVALTERLLLLFFSYFPTPSILSCTYISSHLGPPKPPPGPHPSGLRSGITAYFGNQRGDRKKLDLVGPRLIHSAL